MQIHTFTKPVTSYSARVCHFLTHFVGFFTLFTIPPKFDSTSQYSVQVLFRNEGMFHLLREGQPPVLWWCKNRSDISQPRSINLFGLKYGKVN